MPTRLFVFFVTIKWCQIISYPAINITDWHSMLEFLSRPSVFCLKRWTMTAGVPTSISVELHLYFNRRNLNFGEHSRIPIVVEIAPWISGAGTVPWRNSIIEIWGRWRMGLAKRRTDEFLWIELILMVFVTQMFQKVSTFSFELHSIKKRSVNGENNRHSTNVGD